MGVLFAEENKEAISAASNMGWSFLIAQQIVYLSAIIDFVNHYFKIKSLLLREIFIAMISVHIVWGVYYFIKISFGVNFL